MERAEITLAETEVQITDNDRVPCRKANPCPCDDPCSRVREQIRLSELEIARQDALDKKFSKLPLPKMSAGFMALLAMPKPKARNVATDQDIILASKEAVTFLDQWRQMDSELACLRYPVKGWRRRSSDFYEAYKNSVISVASVECVFLSAFKAKVFLSQSIDADGAHEIDDIESVELKTSIVRDAMNFIRRGEFGSESKR